MRVGVIQPSFIPWRGYFDFIASVDLFIFYDDVQFSKNGWRNRNRIKTNQGSRWITVPVKHRSLSQLILEIEIDNKVDWRKSHFGTWKACYSDCPFYSDVIQLLGDLGERAALSNLSRFNIELISRITRYLKITTPTVCSSEWQLAGKGTARLLDLLMKIGATTYLSGPSADAYLDKDLFRANGISLEYKEYNYSPYPQLWGEFDGFVTILDMIANCGPASSNMLKSTVPDRVIVP